MHLTTTENALSRRRLLLGGLGIVGGGVLLATGMAQPAQASPAVSAWLDKKSANGWPVVPAAEMSKIEGSGLTIAVLSGEVAMVLSYCARRFYYEIDDTLRQGEITGHTANRTVATPYESNYLSGTAIAIRPAWYPTGAGDGFFDHDLIVIRDILADCEGVVRWGGDLRPIKESHFQIDVPPGDPRLRKVAAKIDEWNLTPGAGAGSGIDPFTRERRHLAKILEGIQRPA